MKKVFLTLAAAAAICSANAQNLASGTGYSVDFNKAVDSDGKCYAGLNTDGVGGFGGGNISKTSFTKTNPTTTFLTFVGSATIKKGVTPFFADLFYTRGTGSSATCMALRGDETTNVTYKAIDLSDKKNQFVKITLKSDAINDTVDFFLSSSIDWKFPSASTYNFEGDGKYLVKTVITKSLDFQEFTFDYSAAALAGETNFSEWGSKALVNGFGIKVRKANQVVDIKSIKIGSAAITGISDEEIAALGLSFSPNPAENEVTVSYTSNGKAVSVVLADANGNTVASSVNDKINTSGLAAGLYFAKVLVDGEYATTSKIAVK